MRSGPAGRRIRALGAVAATICLGVFSGVTPASAVSPPRVESAVPVRSSPVGPPEPTEQRTYCATPSAAEHRDRTKPSAAQSMMNLPEAWRFSRGAGQTVAVIDTGVTPHPRLLRLRAGGDYVSTGDGLRDCDAHGTLVAGIIAAQPGPRDAFAGIAPDAGLISIRQSSSAYSAKNHADSADTATAVGSGYGSVRTLASAVVRAVELGATVINISEVACAPAGSRPDDRALGAAVRYAYERDVVVVVAAGNLTQNSGCRNQNPTPPPDDVDGWNAVTTVASPAWFVPYVLTVGSVNADAGTPSSFSLHGPWVSVAAPGTAIVSLDATPGSSKLSDAQPGPHGPVPIAGTSFATPYVSGTVALVRARFPTLSAGEVMERVTRTAHAPGTGRDTEIGYGVIDPVAALTHEIPVEPTEPYATQRIAAPAPPASPDHAARNVAIVGVVVCIAVLAATVGVALPHRRMRRLDPDEY
ncbi:type VII secretion-associated serine protease mycosin [Gordonia sp. CPCC 205515]|uniref:type VII secretion-associated serine protease mycosin n=1 Tax=Gordonia sp. CPCC 205515 TaxID=3140791 RepID=UPI003AF377C8